MLQINLYNTLTKKQELFPKRKEIKMYVCGVTVYDRCHLGHARYMVIYDSFVKYLRKRGIKVTYVTNFTDVDDKIIKKANEENVSWKEIADRYIEAYFEDIEKLNVAKADHYPRASEVMNEIIEFVKDLIDKGYAYEKNGSVYFRVKKFKDYGMLSGINIEELEKEKRIAKEDEVEDPLDFALWKAAKPGEPAWDSPWGKGRPGWHIECSTMIKTILGDTIDLHGGGADLIFPHHENEIAQSHARNCVPLADHWMHIGLLEVKKAKMSKSLKNYFYIQNMAEIYEPQVIRMFLLSASYRKPLEFGIDKIEDIARGRQRLLNVVKRLSLFKEVRPTAGEGTHWQELIKLRDEFEEALRDDFNTPLAIGKMFEISSLALNVMNNSEGIKDVAKFCSAVYYTLMDMDDILGIIGEKYFEDVRESQFLEENLINLLVEIRNKLRKEKRFDLADEIRDKLKEMGIVVEDTKDGSRWFWQN